MGPTPELAGVEDLVEIGRGGFGVVYRAVERDLDRPVAVKVLYGPLDPDAQHRFERERRAMGKVSGHPNVVTVYRAGVTDADRPFIVMELMERGSMRDRLTRDGPIPWREAVESMALITAALEHAHSAGVRHRDIKPGNILLSSHGVPKLGDFGISTLGDMTETQSGAVSATLAHAAPEVVAGQRPDERSDVYSVGSTLFELLHGQPAFARDDEESIAPMLVRIASDPVPSLVDEGVPPDVCQIIEQAMSKDPAARPASAAELERLLRGTMREHIPEPAVGPTGTIRRPLPSLTAPLGQTAPSTQPPPASARTASSRQRLRGILQAVLVIAVVVGLTTLTFTFADVINRRNSLRTNESSASGDDDTTGRVADTITPSESSSDTLSGDGSSGGGSGSGADTFDSGSGSDADTSGTGTSDVGDATLADRLSAWFLQETIDDSASGGLDLSNLPDYIRYEQLSDDSGQVSVEVPVSWDDVQTGSGFITAGPELDGFIGSYAGSGMAVSYSSSLDLDPADALADAVEPGCTESQRLDYSDETHQGAADVWEGCGLDGRTAVLHVAAAPRDGTAGLLFISVQLTSDRDVLATSHVVNSVQVISASL